MDAFMPDNALTVARLCALLLVELAAGYGLQYVDPGRFFRTRAWILLIAATAIAHQITLPSPAGFRMMALIAVLFLGMKAVVAVNARVTGQRALGMEQWLIFAIFWPGMRPSLFSKSRSGALPGWKNLAWNGFLCLVSGIAFMVSAGWIWRETQSTFVVTLLFFMGSSLLVHYGLFTLSAAFWRSRGFDCGLLFLNPFPSETLSEFWGKRWNLAFHEMTADAIYRPLEGILPRQGMLLVSFALSGLFHEVAISLPVQAGFGFPLGYFLFQGILVALERALLKRGWGFSGWAGRLWVIFWIILPLPILFHRPFLAGVVWPLIGVKP
jgi:hypothetical protein